MIHLESKADTIFTTAEGKLNDRDYDIMLPFIKKKIEEHDSIRWYFQMKNFEGWTVSALWRDVKFDLKYNDRLSKVAIVGDKRWHELMANLMKPFTDAEIKYYDEKDAPEATQWIRN